MAIDPNLISTVRVGELPVEAITLESKIAHEIGSDLNQATIQSLVTFLQPYIGTFQYEEKTLHVTTQYITDNFDVSGLGTNLMLGWAICNGANGTPNVQGRVSIGYGGVYSTIGQTGGSKDSVLVSHAHGMRYQTKNASGSGSERVLDNSGSSTLYQNTETSGESGINKNMQPYIVALKVMKL